MALKVPASGKLLSLDVVAGRDAVPSAKKLLKTHSEHGGISTWDASSIFFEMNSLEVNDKPSPRTIVLLYAADLFFRLRWEIIPAMEEGKSVVAVPYVQTGIAFGKLAGLPQRWLDEVFRFAPKPTESFSVDVRAPHKLGVATSGFVEFCSSILSEDLRPQFATYFQEQERRGTCRLL